ncbi:MAG: hypothetical protein COA93_02535 [Alphaproteobacteria bacterium]|nr:MAG: hypothetical protein COA93_02535 [Alphaproteobacteria bacterium]
MKKEIIPIKVNCHRNAEYPISQLYTDCRVHRIFAGTSEIMQEIISRAILKEYEWMRF